METIKQLIDQYGPAVVAAAQRQVGVAIAQDVAWLAVGLVLAVLLVAGTRRLWTLTAEVDSFDRNMVRGFLVLGVAMATAVVFFGFIAGPIGEIWTYTANPDYAVITIVRKMVLAK